MQIQKLKDEIETLKGVLSSLQTEENDAQAQLESLSYAVELTRDEMHRRQRANNELRLAYQSLSPTESEKTQTINSQLSSKVQQLEEELLKAKTAEGNLVYQVEKLEFKLKTCINSSNSITSPTRNSTKIDLPPLNDPPSRPTSLRNSPVPRALRLIGDIDILFTIQNSESKQYIPCRLGISTGRQAAIYSYASSTPLATVHGSTISIADLELSDIEYLKTQLESVDVSLPTGSAEICGFKESIRSFEQLMQEAHTASTVELEDNQLT